MSVLIKGVDMPEYTYAIKLTYFYADDEGNEIGREKIITADQIVKVSTPHGRLIDADSAMEGIKRCRDFNGDYMIILEDIFDGEFTIIEAEE